MIVYSSTKKMFSDDITNGRIVDKILSCLKLRIGQSVGGSQISAFHNSLPYMHIVLSDSEIPDDAGISIEYQIPQTGKRVDFIVSGKDAQNRDMVVIIELKQWETAKLSGKDSIVKTFIGGGEREVTHPSYQAWSYAALLEDFHETVYVESIVLKPCAYLHNYNQDNVITNKFYADCLQKAPVFLKSDALKLRKFIEKHVKHGDAGEIMYRIDHGRIRPSKSLADKLSSLLQGNQEFIMIDDQKIVYENALTLANKACKGSKQVLIVEGGPGTGKSVVAINLLVALINKRLNVQYVTKNAAPRTVYESKLTGTFKKTRIANLFCGSGAYTECTSNLFDALIVDEAHRLNEKSGMFKNKGDNQIKEIIRSAKLSVFFIDEDQRVTLKDIGEKKEIAQWAKQLGATVQYMELSSQFRCNGSDGYLPWLDNTLQIRETTNAMLDISTYDFRILSSPIELRDLIYEKNKINNKARIVAGYCWNWVSKTNPDINDIQIPEHGFAMRWNLASDGNLWILKPESVREVGCIHTCQGLDLDYVGVIIGPDLICRNEKIITDPKKRANTDSSVKGYKKLLEKDPEQAAAKMDAIIKNTYRTLMTRGMKGCYVYFVDKETEAFFKSRISTLSAYSEETIRSSEIVADKPQFVPSIKQDIPDWLQYKEYLPVRSLKAAAGSRFGTEDYPEELGWMKVETRRKLTADMFVAQVTGKSMEPTITDGSYCVFQFERGGSRNGKVVLVQSRQVTDRETNQTYTVKRYSSEKELSDDGTWRHKRITLSPDNKTFEAIVLENVPGDDFRVVAEFVAVVGD
jgi:uncharacterized protein